MILRKLKDNELYDGMFVQCNDSGNYSTTQTVFYCIYKIIIRDGNAYYIGASNSPSDKGYSWELKEIIHASDLVFDDSRATLSPGDVWLETDLTRKLNRDKQLSNLSI